LIQLADEILNDAMKIDSMNAMIYIARYNWVAVAVDDIDSRHKVELQLAEKASMLDPNNAYAYFKKMQSYQHFEEYDKAIEAQKKAIELDPFSVTLNRNYFHILCYAGRTEDAKAFYEKHNKLLDYNGTQHHYFRISYIENEEWNKAIYEARAMINLSEVGFNRYDIAVRTTISDMRILDPDIELYEEVAKKMSVKSYRNAINYLLILDRLGRLEEANEVLKDSTAFWLSENERSAQLFQAEIYYLNREFKNAEGLYSYFFPNSSSRFYCWTQLGRSDEVRNLLATDSIKGPYHRSFLYAGLGEIDSALFYFEQVESWKDVAWSRFDIDMKPLWNEPRYKAKVASFGFPEVKNIIKE
jgi:tetratricopeptide (TPR) repeat protein